MKNLKSIINREKKVSKASFFVNSGLFIIGESMQLATKNNVIDYNWFTGHLSDFAIPAYFTSLFMATTTGENFYKRLIMPIFIATAPTIAEFHSTGNTSIYDPWDIACYWAGTISTFLGIKLFSSGYFQNSYNYIKDKLYNYKTNRTKKNET